MRLRPGSPELVRDKVRIQNETLPWTPETWPVGTAAHGGVRAFRMYRAAAVGALPNIRSAKHDVPNLVALPS